MKIGIAHDDPWTREELGKIILDEKESNALKVEAAANLLRCYGVNDEIANELVRISYVLKSLEG